MPKRYSCRYADFGCNVTRTRRAGIRSHEHECTFRHFEKYVQSMELVEKLRQEIFELKMLKRRGRPEVIVDSVDFRDFGKLFMADTQMIKKWKVLARTPRNGIKALIVIFANAMPRFYKLRNLSEIDVNVYLPTLRTHGRMQRHTMDDLADGLFSAAEALISENVDNLQFGKIDDYRFRPVVPFDRTFVYNVLSAAAKRKSGERIEWDGRSVSSLETSDTITI